MKLIFSLFTGTRLVTTVLFAASLALSLASAVTTYLGMRDYSGFLLVAAGVTFGVQCLLFAISWWLGQNWRRGWGHIIGGGIIFLTCAFVSVFFSFASLYTTIDGGRSDIAAQARMEDRVSELEKELTRKLTAQIRARSEAIVGSSASEQWQENVNQVLDRARGAPAELRAKATAERDAAQVQLIEEERKLRAIQDQLDYAERAASALDSRVSEVEARLEDARNRRIAAEDSVRDLEAKIEQETIRRDAEAAQGGCGRDCRAIERQIGNLEVDLAGAQRALEQTTRLESEAQTNFDVASQPNSELADQNALNEQKALIETRISDLKDSLGEIAAQLQEFVGDSVALVRAQLADFNELDFSNFKEAVNSCNWLKEQLIAAEAMELATAPDCSGSAIVPELEALDRLVQRQKQFGVDCNTSTLFVDQLSFAELRTFGDVCISSAGFLDEETRAIKNELFAMEQSRGEGAHSFAKVQASLMQDGDPLAKLALALAIAIDVLVLLCAFIGTNVGTSEHARALQYVLLHKMPDQQSPGDEILPEPEGKQEMMLFKKASDWLSTRGLASLAFADDGTRRGLKITREAAIVIQKELFNETSNANESRSAETRAAASDTASSLTTGNRRIRQFRRKT